MKYADIIAKAKTYIDSGFDAMGRKVPKSSKDIFLVCSCIRAVRFTDAIVLLCTKNFTEESLPLLRSLIETAINMRWVMNKNTGERLKKYFENLKQAKLGSAWSPDMYSRMEELGYDRSYYELVVKFCHSHTHGNASSLPYGQLIDHPELKKDPMSAEAVYSVAAQMLGHVLKALDAAYKMFPQHQEIWDEMEKVNEEIRQKKVIRNGQRRISTKT